MFNFTGVLTGQSIQLLGMLTEAMHTPFLMDRALAINNARLMFNAARHLAENLEIKPHSWLLQRSAEVLDRAITMLERIAEIGLFQAIADGMFADIKRPPEGGKGGDGVVLKSADYANPLLKILTEKVHGRH
jgi:beta-lysine 5,6-aminomutase alpha subunit